VSEQYSPGQQKIFYLATGGKTGKEVVVEICRSTEEDCVEVLDLIESVHFPGVYSFSYLFSEGTYLANFFENGNRTISQVYSIRRYTGKRFLGPQVIGQ